MIHINKGNIVDNNSKFTTSNENLNAKLISSQEIIEALNTDQLKVFVVNETNVDSGFKKSNSSLNINAKKIKNKYWNITKNLQASYVFGKNVLKNVKAKNREAKTKATPTIQQIRPLYVDEREWFKKKYEREIGKVFTRKETQISDLEKCLRFHEMLKCGKEIRIYKEYVEPPRPDNLPDVVWGGPLMRRCGCPKNDCECRGNILLPPKHIACVTRYTWRPLYYLRALTCFKKWQPPEPQKTFAQRLQESVEAETETYKKLNEMGVLEKRGPEFCIYRCFFYHLPETKPDNEYFALKQQLLESYKKNMDHYNRVDQDMIIGPPTVMEVKIPVEEDVDLDVPIIDGFYRTVSTQSNTGPNGDFIMGKISHILFARMDGSILYDIEGNKLNISSYKEFHEIPKLQTLTSKLDNLFSLEGIKSKFSKLSSNFLSSIIEIKDTGIPVNSQATQDPPLDDYYQSMIEIPHKVFLNSKNERDTDICPCCEFYKITSPLINVDVFEPNIARDAVKSNEINIETVPQLFINTPKEKISNEVRNYKDLEGAIPEKFDNILLSSPQHNFSPRQKNVENQLITFESSKFIEENENTNIKLSTLPQAEENKIVKISGSNDNNDKIRNKISVIGQNIKASNNVIKINDLEMLQNNGNNINPNNKKLPIINLTFDKKSPENNLLNIEDKMEEDVPIVDNKLQNNTTEILTDSNEKSNEIVETARSFSNTLNIKDFSMKQISEKINQPGESFKKLSSINQNNIKIIEEHSDRSNKSFPEKHAINSSNTDVHMLLNSKTTLKYNFTQKPSIKSFASKNSQRVELRKRIRNVLSYENFKLHVKKSFQKTSSAFSAFFKCAEFTSGFAGRNFKDINNNHEVSKNVKLDANARDDIVKVSSSSNKNESKISEKEMFSLQYSNLVPDTESSVITDVASGSRKK